MTTYIDTVFDKKNIDPTSGKITPAASGAAAINGSMIQYIAPVGENNNGFFTYARPVMEPIRRILPAAAFACILATSPGHASTGVLTVQTVDRWHGISPYPSSSQLRQIIVYGPSGYYRETQLLGAGSSTSWNDAPRGEYRIRVIWFCPTQPIVARSCRQRENNYHGRPFSTYNRKSARINIAP